MSNSSMGYPHLLATNLDAAISGRSSLLIPDTLEPSLKSPNITLSILKKQKRKPLARAKKKRDPDRIPLEYGEYDRRTI